jgi:hypothetical protein
MDLRPWEFDSPLGHWERSLKKEEAMGTEFGGLIFKAVTLIIVAGVAALFFIVNRYLKTKYEDGPDYRES